MPAVASTHRRLILTAGVVAPAVGLLLTACSNTSTSSMSPPVRDARPVADVRTFHRMITPEEAADYAGDASCARCHPGVSAQQGASRHKRTLAAVSEASHGEYFRDSNRVTDGLLGYTYEPAVRNGQCVIAGKGPGGKGALTADYVMGSGRNAFTFLSRVEPDNWIDMRVSYYLRPKRWDYTPMQKPGDRTFARAAGIEQRGERLASCLLCHSTTVVEGPDGPDVEKSHFGIGCERCHGPSRAHVDSAGRLADRGSGKIAHLEDLSRATPERISEVCGGCHKTEKMAPPGDPHTENGLARFQPAALSRSRCFQESGTLSCVTCHDPHGDADPDPARNDAQCRSCHRSDAARIGKTVCKVNRVEGCVRCHMPAQAIKSIPHAAYHHHWIKVWPEQESRDPHRLQRKTLKAG